MLVDHYYVVNILASLLPREKRAEFKTFIENIVNDQNIIADRK